jgi:hypothetical protein
MQRLGVVYNDQAKYDDAIAVLRQAFELRRRLLGATDSSTAVTMTYLGLSYLRKADYAQALGVRDENFCLHFALGGRPSASDRGPSALGSSRRWSSGPNQIQLPARCVDHHKRCDRIVRRLPETAEGCSGCL